MSRDRARALSVLMPRLLGGVEQHGRVTRTGKRCWPGLNATGGDFLVRFIPRRGSIFVGVHWCGYLVFTASIVVNCLGTHLGGRISFSTWERGQSLGEWQSDLFDQFDRDSDRLLTCAVNDIPYVAALIARVDPSELEMAVVGRPPRSKSTAAQLLWHQLLDACHRAAGDGVTLDELGSIAIELGLGLRGFGSSAEELADDLASIGDLVRAGQIDTVFTANAGWSKLKHRAWAKSWIREASGLSEPCADLWAFAQMIGLDRLRSHRLTHREDSGRTSKLAS